MNILKDIKNAPLTLSVGAFFIWLALHSSEFQPEINSTRSQTCFVQTDSVSKVLLDSSGYFVLVPADYYMSRKPYPTYVADPDVDDEMYCFFPTKLTDTVCRTRLLISFDKGPLPKTGYSRGSEFNITGHILGREVIFLDHSTCCAPFRMRSAFVKLDSGDYLSIVIEARPGNSMDQLFEIAQSLHEVH